MLLIAQRFFAPSVAKIKEALPALRPGHNNQYIGEMIGKVFQNLFAIVMIYALITAFEFCLKTHRFSCSLNPVVDAICSILTPKKKKSYLAAKPHVLMPI